MRGKEREFKPLYVDYPQKEFYMFRHPQTEGNQSKVLMGGGAEVPLSGNGERQIQMMKRLVEKLPPKSFPKKIIHSGMKRTAAPVTQINEMFNLPVQISEELKERNYGSLQGKPHSALSDREAVEAATGLESEEDFCKRMNKGMASHIENSEAPILFVLHRGNFKAFGKNYGRSLDAGNAELYHFKPDLSDANFPWKVYRVTLQQDNIKETEVVPDIDFSATALRAPRFIAQRKK